MSEGIFISYKRKGGSILAGLLYNELCKHFKAENIFKDMKSINPGEDYKQKIIESIDKSDIFLVLLNNHWISEMSEDINYAVISDDNVACFEIYYALSKKLEVIPVLFENTVMPKNTDLHSSVREITAKQAFNIDSDRVMEDIIRLVAYVKTKRKFSFEDGTMFGSTERLIKDPINTLKKTITGTLDIYKKDFLSLRGILKKKKE